MLEENTSFSNSDRPKNLFQIWNQVKSITRDAFIEANSCLSPFNKTRLKNQFRYELHSSDSETDYTSFPEDDNKNPDEMDKTINPIAKKIDNVFLAIETKTDPNFDFKSIEMTPNNLELDVTIGSSNTISPKVNSELNLEDKDSNQFGKLEIKIPPCLPSTFHSCKLSLDVYPFNEEKSPYANKRDKYKPIRSSSLKPPRSYPETNSPNSSVKKAVRFANAFGIDLVNVRQIFDLDDPPIIPASALSDLHLEPDFNLEEPNINKKFDLCFSQPGASLGFLDKVRKDSISLENASVDKNILKGLVRVLSRSFQKAIIVRISYNNWMSHGDTPATYIENSHDGVTDQFAFTVLLSPSIEDGDIVEFALKYETPGGEQFWDNNHGSNYVLKCNF